MNQPIRILLVDDSPHFLAAARDFLHYQQPLNVIGEATDGETAFEKFGCAKPDIILLDINLGGKSGLELIFDFKERQPTVKIIILTILPEEPYRALALRMGADAFVSKSNMTQTLVPTINKLMERTGEKPNGNNHHPGEAQTRKDGSV